MKSLFKKIAIIIPIIMALIVPLGQVYAVETPNVDSGETTTTPKTTPESPTYNECRYLLGMPSWDCKVNTKPSNQDQLVATIWTIATNVLTSISIAASYLIIGFVIYGGYQYMTASGDPGKVASAKKTLTNAFIGLAIVMFSGIIFSTIRTVVGVNLTEACTLENGTLSGSCNSLESVDTMVVNIIHWVTRIAGIISVVFVILGGISYMTSSGDPGKVKKAKDVITYAIIGLAIVAFTEIITAFVTNIIRDAGNAPSTSLIETTIAKEINNEN